MKTFLTLIFTLYSFILFSQNMLNENKQWVYWVGTDQDGFTRNDCLSIIGDTVLSEISYKKLYSYYNCSSYNTLKGFIRETNDSLIYFRYPYENTEFILYDFRLQQGDSMKIHNLLDRYFHVDSTYQNNFNQKEICLSTNNSTLKWIEKVGSDTGLLMETIVGGIYIFNCCLENNEVLYHNAENSSCFLSANTLKENKCQIKVTPIGNNQLKVLNDYVDEGKLQIYDITGELILQSEIDNSSGIYKLKERGVYIYLFKSKENQIQKGKLLIY